MRKAYGRILSRGILKGLKIVSLSALGSLVVICSPRAVCHVSAAEAAKFSTYLMIDENGDFAKDGDGEYIQLFDEKGNLLVYNEDVKEFLRTHADENGKKKLAAKEKEFFLINGKLYSDEYGNNELSDLSEVMPSVFKYGAIESGYTMEADNTSVYINPLDIDGDPVYVARVGGSDAKLPAFTITRSGDISYLERGRISDGEREALFVYDSNNFYDENLNRLESLGRLVPEAGDENSPMFAGYYIKDEEGRRQLIDVDGRIVMSSGDYGDLVKKGAAATPEYCNVITLSLDGEQVHTLYSDIDSGVPYNDYQRMDVFSHIGDGVLGRFTGDEGRGHFAGLYGSAGEESLIRYIDENGDLIEDSIGAVPGNADYYARYYNVITADGSEDGHEVYFSEGNVYSDPELLSKISNITEVTGSVPEDVTEEIHSDEKDMDGTVTRYFIGYYFASDFWDEEDMEREILLSEYEEEGFDPANVDINKIKFADRDGNIVFDPENAPAIDGDMAVYQNWYTVTVWDDGEVEVSDDADEAKEEEKDPEEETDTEEIAEGEEESSEDDASEGMSSDGEPGDEAASGYSEGDPAADDASSTSSSQDETGEGKSDVGQASEGGSAEAEVVEETALPSQEDEGNNEEQDDAGEGGSNEGGADMDMDVPRQYENDDQKDDPGNN